MEYLSYPFASSTSRAKLDGCEFGLSRMYTLFCWVCQFMPVFPV
jgi:hypothetical protein